MKPRIFLALVVAALVAACGSSATRPPSPTPAARATATPPSLPTATPDPRPSIGTPKWFDDAVVYQIFPRSFYDTNGDGVGDLRGVAQKLDHIQSLGANTIWLTPFYPSTTYHGYDVVDYFNVNPELGTLEDFKFLSSEMKKRGMKLIVDYVANHSSNGHPFFKDAYKNPASKYTKWYTFNDAGNTSYASFFGVDNLPEWNTDNPDVVDYLTKAALFWLDNGADGLRADYALGVEAPFWKQLRAAVKAKHPDALLLGEVWDQNALKLDEYFGFGFDALFDFPFALNFTGNIDKNGDGILNGAQPGLGLAAPLKVMQRRYPRDAQLVRFISNHDTNRIASEVNADPARERLAAAVNLLTPGIPEIYYGEEIGMPGSKGAGPAYDEYRREGMDWFAAEAGRGMTTWFKPADRNNKPNDGVSVEEQDKDAKSLLNAYRGLGKLRADHPALRGRDFQVMDAVPGCESACLGVWRWAKDELIAVVFNFSDKPQPIRLDVTSAPVRASGEPTTVWGDATSAKSLPAWGATATRWALAK